MEYLHEMWLFIWAVVNNWAGYCTGGVIVAFLGLWTTVKQVLLPKKVWLGFTLVFLFFAIFNAWRDQYVKTQPGLFLQVQMGEIAEFTDNSGVGVFLQVAVDNRGLQTSAMGWRLHIKPPNGDDIEFPARLIGDKPVKVQGYSFSPDDALYLKTLAPIPTGAEISGILVFALPNEKPDEYRKKGAVLTLTCTDAYGNEIKTQKTITWRQIPHRMVSGRKATAEDNTSTITTILDKNVFL
jgi:hypothetical protein